jgi:parallel beta-helix repeat protein
MKKIMTLGILVLFALSCFLPLVAGFSSESGDSFSLCSGSQVTGDIIIVDDEGDGDYTSIKEALNSTDPGDTIEVYSGTYYEYDLDIEIEDITLKGILYELGNGNDIGKPLIHGQGKGKVMRIWAKRFTITGFRIENGGGTIACGIIGIQKDADNCVISDNDIAHAITGCVGIISNNNKILNNTISHSAIRQGIALGEECKNNTISGNVISDVEIGIDLWDSNHNTVIGNKISRCWEFGIDIAGSDYNTVKGNSFEDNAVGVHIIYHSRGCRIKNNNFINNQLHAYFVYGFPIFWCLTNRWNGNYWNGTRTMPYPIRGGHFFFIPFVQFDWRPALKPYDI